MSTVLSKIVQYRPDAACQPLCGLRSALARCQASIGDMDEVLDMRWTYWFIELKPAFTVSWSRMEYLADARSSGAA